MEGSLAPNRHCCIAVGQEGELLGIQELELPSPHRGRHANRRTRLAIGRLVRVTFGTSCALHSRLNYLPHGNGSSNSTGGAEMTTFHSHPPSRVLSLMAAACVVLTVALLGLQGAAVSTARADSTDADAKFLAALSSRGTTYASPEVMIAAGHAVCAELDRGESPSRVAQDVMNNKDVLTGSNLGAHHAGFFVGASIAAYCPNYAGRT